MQTVFRIRPARSKKRAILSTEDSPSSSAAAAIKARRRSHKKSRYGCQNCKVRRVKCDENRSDGCRNCQQHGIECDYTLADSPTLPSLSDSTATSTIVTPISTTISTRTGTPLSALTPISTDTLDTTLIVLDDTTIFDLSTITRPPSPVAKLYPTLSFTSSLIHESPSFIAPPLQTLSYFSLFTCSTVTSTSGVPVFRDSLLALSHNCDFLMHAFLGVSAAHLREHASSSITTDTGQLVRLRQTETYHWARALHGYREALTGPPRQETADALITVCMLLGIYTFYVPKASIGLDIKIVSFVDAPAGWQRKESLQWLAVVNGFVAVMKFVGRFIGSCAWAGVFEEAGRKQVEDDERCRGRDNVILAKFLDLCDVDLYDTITPNVYREALVDLSALLLNTEVTMRDFAMLMAFQGRLSGVFHKMLLVLDPKALLIMLYWLVLLESLGLWWTRTRSYCEANAIIRYLANEPDLRIQELLEIPRKAFGVMAAD